MSKRTMLAALIAAGLPVLASAPAHAWGPRTEAAVVTTAMHLISKSGDAPLSRLEKEIMEGVKSPVNEIEIKYPNFYTDPVNAIEMEMGLLTAARGGRVDAYFAYRLGVLGKMVSMVSAPLRGAPVTQRTLYYGDADKAVATIALKPAPRKEVDPKGYFTRLFDETRVNEELITRQYQDGIGFGGVAAATFQADASRSVAAVADVWWTVLASRTTAGGISESQLRDYVLSAYTFFIQRGSLREIESADKAYAKIAAFTPDMRAKIGDALLAAGFADRAIKEYETVMAANPDRRDVAQKIADYYVSKGEEALKGESLEDARTAFEKAAKANPLHGSAEARRLETESLITARDGRMASFQASIQQASDLRDLAEQEAARDHYAEAITLLQQAEAAYGEVTDEFPTEAQQRNRGLRDVQDRLAQLKGSLTGGAMSFSGSAFEGDVKALAAKGVEGIETEAVTLLLEKMYRAENDRLAQSLQQAFETQ